MYLQVNKNVVNVDTCEYVQNILNMFKLSILMYILKLRTELTEECEGKY